MLTPAVRARMMSLVDAEGWYIDPFGAHELRWFSAGIPTDLVRDGETESTDIPPSPTWDPPVAPPEPVNRYVGVDLFRVDRPSQASTAYDESLAERDFRRRHPWVDLTGL